MKQLILNVPRYESRHAARLGCYFNDKMWKFTAVTGCLVTEVLRRIYSDDPDMKRILARGNTLANLAAGWACRDSYLDAFDDLTTPRCDHYNHKKRILEAQAPDGRVYYLHVDPVHHDVARRHGAKWDPVARGWFTGPDTEIAKCHRLMDQGRKPVYDPEHDALFRDLVIIRNMVMPGTWTRHFGGKDLEVKKSRVAYHTGSPQPAPVRLADAS